MYSIACLYQDCIVGGIALDFGPIRGRSRVRVRVRGKDEDEREVSGIERMCEERAESSPSPLR